MIEKYYKYKINYSNYIVMIKTGNFYEVFNKDALILNNIFKYKLKRLNKLVKCGFPINSLGNILITLDNNRINYFVYDKNIINHLNNNLINSSFLDKVENLINEW